MNNLNYTSRTYFQVIEEPLNKKSFTTNYLSFMRFF